MTEPLCLIGLVITLIGHALSLIGLVITLIRQALSLIRLIIALISWYLCVRANWRPHRYYDHPPRFFLVLPEADPENVRNNTLLLSGFAHFTGYELQPTIIAIKMPWQIFYSGDHMIKHSVNLLKKSMITAIALRTTSAPICSIDITTTVTSIRTVLIGTPYSSLACGVGTQASAFR